MKILLIEDMAGFAVPIRQALEARGHAVVWIIGATRVDEDKVIGILASPDAQPLNDSWNGDGSRLIEVTLADFELALVDGGLIGPVNSGVPFVSALSRIGVPAICITGGGAGNPPLIAAGASCGLPKEHVLLSIVEDLLPPPRPRQGLKRYAKRLSRFSQELRRKAEAARQRKEKFDYGYQALRDLDR
ncbi:MAG TPA: hypothetical protein V6D17_16775 [Candidatus Obscuribacterales bacterium]